MKKFTYIILLLCTTILQAEKLTVDDTQFFYKAPTSYNKDSKVIVLFGGKNWTGDKTLKEFDFDNISEKYNAFLISPSFKDNDYWQPEKWSGQVLKNAILALEEKFKLDSPKLIFYGYSAGGQSANLFYNYMPERVIAWGAHACGVYPEKVKHSKAPAIITCGLNDTARLQISRSFIYKYRENGGKLIFKYYNTGHELNKDSLEIAKAFFSVILENKKTIKVGEDDTMQTFPLEKISDIEIEFRNPLYSENLKKLWEKE